MTATPSNGFAGAALDEHQDRNRERNKQEDRLPAVFGHRRGRSRELGAEFGPGGVSVGDGKSIGHPGDVIYPQAYQVDAEYDRPESMSAKQDEDAERGRKEHPNEVFDRTNLYPRKAMSMAASFRRLAMRT
jgi:hypothetical protein